MNIEKSSIEKLRITEVDGLDPIDVFIDITSTTSGKVTINCYGKSWTAFWPSVGEKGIKSFFKRSDNEYLIGYLDASITRKTVNWDAYSATLIERAKSLPSHVLENSDIEVDDVISAIEELDHETLDIEYCNYPDGFTSEYFFRDAGMGESVTNELLADEINITFKDHHHYIYLSKIVDAVKLAV
jgi:hypothetical protein